MKIDKRLKTALIVGLGILIISVILTLSKKDLTVINTSDMLGKELGFLTLIPTILAVILAFISHNVIISLLLGFISGILIYSISRADNFVVFFKTFVFQTFDSAKNVVINQENIKIIILCLAVGGMIEIVRLSGGFEALAIKLTKKVNTPRKANLIGGVLGCLIFFDDYANSLIVGPIMKPITDRVGVSREKLSYIVDSTAAPVTGISIISSWVAVEISSIEQGLEATGINENGFTYFLESVPYCFYCIFALIFVFLGSLLNRDYGPMLIAEKRARRGEPISKASLKVEGKKRYNFKGHDSLRAFIAIFSIILLVSSAVIGFYSDGKRKAIALGIITNASFSLANIIKYLSLADTMKWIIIASALTAIFVVIIGLIFKLFTFKETVKSWLFGIKKLLPTIALLLLAWCLADTVGKLGTSYYVVELISSNVPWQLVPVLIFVTCCGISFVGGSFSCLFVVMPLAIPLAYKIMEMGIVSNPNAFFLNCVGSVMAGSIFGDHCSPITDCTILSALGSGCDTMEHVKTQMPYALTVGIISLIAILLISLSFNIYLIWLLAIITEVLVLMLLGKKVS